jgi:hypothetical protein
MDLTPQNSNSEIVRNFDVGGYISVEMNDWLQLFQNDPLLEYADIGAN